MTTNDKQYYIYIRSTKDRIPCTEEEFHNYYHDIDLFRQRQQYHKQCVGPQKKWLECDIDCQTCPFHRNEVFSLDKPLETKNGNTVDLYETIADDSSLIADIVADKDKFGQLLRRLQEIMPEAIEIGKLRQQGLNDSDVAAQIGTPRTTFLSRLKKAKQILENEFSEIF